MSEQFTVTSWQYTVKTKNIRISTSTFAVSFPYFNETGSVYISICKSKARASLFRRFTYTNVHETVLLKYGKLAAEYPWIYCTDIFVQCTHDWETVCVDRVYVDDVCRSLSDEVSHLCHRHHDHDHVMICSWRVEAVRSALSACRPQPFHALST